MVLVVLYGPKGAGKSQVAKVLRTSFGVAHVDADAVVLGLQAAGVRPHPEHGWLSYVEAEVREALAAGRRLRRTRGTGASSLGVGPLEIALTRLKQRTSRKVPVTVAEARRIHDAAIRQAGHRRFDLRIDTSELTKADLPHAVQTLRPLLTPGVGPADASRGHD